MFLELTRSDLAVNLIDLVLQVLLTLLRLLELLLDHQTMIGLHDLFIHKLVPSLRIELIVKIEVVAIGLLRLEL